ncbi:MAG: hypothetical protein Tsb0017_02350 [Geothermobacteraceae bacterium]
MKPGKCCKVGRTSKMQPDAGRAQPATFIRRQKEPGRPGSFLFTHSVQGAGQLTIFQVPSISRQAVP